MKIPHIFSIWFLTCTVQAYSEYESIHESGHLLAKHLEEQSDGTLFGRDLEPVKIYTRSTLLKRMTPPGSPRQRNRASSGDANRQVGLGILPRVKPSYLAGGIVSAGTILGIHSMTDWHNPPQAAAATLAMACAGIATAVGFCAPSADPRRGYTQFRNSVSNAMQGRQGRSGASNEGASSSVELQTVPPIQGSSRHLNPSEHSNPSRSPSPSRPSSPPRSNDPLDLVRRSTGNAKMI